MDDLEFDLGDDCFSSMLHDLDTSVFGEENEPGVFMAKDANNNGAAGSVLQPKLQENGNNPNDGRRCSSTYCNQVEWV